MLIYSTSSRKLITWPDYKRPRLNRMLFNCLWSRGIESSVTGCMEASSIVRNMLILGSWVASTTLRARSVPIWNMTRPALPFLLTNRLYISWLPWQHFWMMKNFRYDYDNDKSECTSGTHELEAKFDSDNFEAIQNVCTYILGLETRHHWPIWCTFLPWTIEFLRSFYWRCHELAETSWRAVLQAAFCGLRQIRLLHCMPCMVFGE